MGHWGGHTGWHVAICGAILIGLLVAGLAGPAVAQSSNSTVNATTDWPLHKQPSNVSEAGERTAVVSRLEADLAQRLNLTAIAVQDRDFDEADLALGKAYLQRVEQYEEVAEGENVSRIVEELNASREQLQELAAVAADAEETLQAYREARDAGNEERARRLARDLVASGQQVQQLGTELQGDLDQLSDATGMNIGEAQETIAQVVNQSETATDRLADDAFVETRLTAEAVDPRGSPLEPVVITGQVTAADGTSVQNGTVAITGIDDEAQTTTDADGRFRLAYRPTLLPTTTDAVTVAYQPADAAPYRAASESVSIAPARRTGTLTAESTVDRVGYTDQLQVTATARVDETPMADVPIVATAGPLRLTGRTNASGQVTLVRSIPPDLPAGEQTLRIGLATTNRSLALPPVTRSLTVTETPTTLTVSATTSTAPNVSADSTQTIVSGRLQTPVGTPAEQPITIRVDGESATTVLTDSTGAFDATLTLSDDRRHTITAAYDVAGTNLAPATTTVTVGTGLSSQQVALLGGGLVGLVALAGVILYRRGWRPGSVDDDPDSRGGTVGSDAGDGSPPTTAADLASVIDTAERLQADNPDAAAALAYGTVRATLLRELEAPRGATHWEFYRTCKQDGFSDATVEDLETLTEYYERAVYAPDGLSEQAAQDAIALARQVAAAT